jgi:hypothetical protein
MWRPAPAVDETRQRVSTQLARRLTQLVDETRGRHIYYERLHALLAVASVAA